MDTYSDFFSYPSINDFFSMDHFGHYGWVFTKNYTNWIWYIVRDNDSTLLNYLNNNSGLVNSFYSKSLFSFFYEKDSYIFLNHMAVDMVSLGFIKNNYQHLLRSFPDDYDAIMNAVICSIAEERNLIEEVSTPFVKLYYPEPFIASPYFVHEDVWFIHILHYQHWLWFFFISLIMFYFVMFLLSVQYCSSRNQSKRETRGASRSKCADLITACVPVSWAMAIIISETVDNTDYYDGFGTGQIVIGMRAYQWGWEYLYPKITDLNYSNKLTYSSTIDNLSKYNDFLSKNSIPNSFWKSYQKKNTQSISLSPSHLLLHPSDNSKLISGASFNNVGLSSVKDSSAFRKIQYFSKSNKQPHITNITHFNDRYNKVNSMYLNTSKFKDAYSYGTFKQHNFMSLNANLPSFESLLYDKGVNNFVNFTLNSNSKLIKNVWNILISKSISQFKPVSFSSLNSTSLSNLKNLTVINSSCVHSKPHFSSKLNRIQNIIYELLPFLFNDPSEAMMSRNVSNPSVLQRSNKLTCSKSNLTKRNSEPQVVDLSISQYSLKPFLLKPILFNKGTQTIEYFIVTDRTLFTEDFNVDNAVLSMLEKQSKLISCNEFIDKINKSFNENNYLLGDLDFLISETQDSIFKFIPSEVNILSIEDLSNTSHLLLNNLAILNRLNRSFYNILHNINEPLLWVSYRSCTQYISTVNMYYISISSCLTNSMLSHIHDNKDIVVSLDQIPNVKPVDLHLNNPNKKLLNVISTALNETLNKPVNNSPRTQIINKHNIFNPMSTPKNNNIKLLVNKDTQSSFSKQYNPDIPNDYFTKKHKINAREMYKQEKLIQEKIKETQIVIKHDFAKAMRTALVKPKDKKLN